MVVDTYLRGHQQAGARPKFTDMRPGLWQMDVDRKKPGGAGI